jgi:hypothetical protein
MSRSLIVIVSLLLAGASFSALPSYGQGVGGIPGGAPLSPWLNLYQRNAGPVDNYHMYVQPAQQLRGTLQMQQYGIQNNARAVNTVAEQFNSQAAEYMAVANPTGNGAGFMNQGRYFFNNGGFGGNTGGGGGVVGLPGTGGFGRPGGVGAFGTPGLGGAHR